MSELLHSHLINTLSYNPDTGIFTKPNGNRAGTLHNSGYRYIQINNKAYAEHRLAWYYCFHEWPENQIDHIDRNRSNNSIDNLREVTNRVNARNRVDSSKYGSNIYPNKSKFIVQFHVSGKVYRYGSHTLERAVLVRDFVLKYLDNNIPVPNKETLLKELDENLHN